MCVVALASGLLIFSRCKLNERFCDPSTAANKHQALHGADAGTEKQKGAHVFGIVEDTDFQPITQKNINWITLVSWGFQQDIDSPLLTHHDGDSLHIRQHDAHWVRRIEQVRAAGFKVFFKPHLWIDAPPAGKWRADIYPASEADWEVWKNSYRDFICRYANVAERAKADMFCIGAEFSRLSVEKPAFWESLIQEVRTIYTGKITYAANWHQEFEHITFWDQLDFIGIQAYFPLADTHNPSLEQLSMGWNKHLPAMESTHNKYKRNIIFTELGYKSTANSAITPWTWLEHASDAHHLYSAETQANCYEAFFQTVWEKEWFAGVHIWQMRSDFVPDSGRNNLDFTPQGKPAEQIITKGFE